MRRVLTFTFIVLTAVIALPQKPKRPDANPNWKPRLENTPPKETKSHVRSLNASSESLATLRRFLSFIFKPEPNLTKDKSAQVELLSQHVRDGIEHLWKEYSKLEPDNAGAKCSPPDNDVFVGAWDYPSTYSIVGSRAYERRTIIDVSYRWGPETNYSGDERLMSYVLVFEAGKWKVDDIYIFRGEFIDAETLTGALWVDTYKC